MSSDVLRCVFGLKRLLFRRRPSLSPCLDPLELTLNEDIDPLAVGLGRGVDSGSARLPASSAWEGPGEFDRFPWNIRCHFLRCGWRVLSKETTELDGGTSDSAALWNLRGVTNLAFSAISRSKTPFCLQTSR